MDAADLARLTAETLYLVLLVSAPALIASLLVGLAVGLLQAVTQVQEQTLSFVPKLVAVAGVLLAGGHWMMREMVGWVTQLWNSIPSFIS